MEIVVYSHLYPGHALQQLLHPVVVDVVSPVHQVVEYLKLR